MSLVVFDLETSGLSITKDTPIQICAKAFSPDFKETDCLLYYVYRKEPLAPIITEITGITLEKLQAEGIPPLIAVERWQKFLRKHYPVHLAGYNATAFDYPMIMNWVDGLTAGKFKFPPVHQVTDVMHMVGKYFKTTKWLKLRTAAERLNIAFEAASLHDAKADVTLTADVWKKVWTSR